MFVNFLAIRKALEFSSPGTYTIDMRDANVQTVQVDKPDTTLIIHNKANFTAEFFDINQVFISSIIPNSDSLFNIHEKKGSVVITKTGNLDFLYISIIFPDSTNNMTDCEKYVVSTNQINNFSINSSPYFESSYHFFNDITTCFIFANPNVNSYAISQNATIYKRSEYFRLSLVKIYKVPLDSYFTLIPSPPYQDKDVKTFQTEFVPGKSITVKNGQRFMNLVDYVYDINLKMTLFSQLTVFCPKKTTVFFRSNTSNVDIITITSSLRNINTEIPLFAFGNEDGYIIFKKAKNTVVSFTSYTLKRFDCESTLFISENSTDLVHISNTTQDLCIFATSSSEYTVTDTSNIWYDIYLPSYEKLILPLHRIPLHTALIVYKSSTMNDINITFNFTQPSDLVYFSRYPPIENSRFLEQGDLRDPFSPLVLNLTDFTHRSIELLKDQKLILNINTPMAFYLHNSNETDVVAVINDTKTNISGLFDFGNSTGQVLIYKNTENRVYNILFTAFPNNYSKIYFTTKAEDFNICSPLYNSPRNMLIRGSESVLYVYASSSFANVTVSSSLDNQGDKILFYGYPKLPFGLSPVKTGRVNANFECNFFALNYKSIENTNTKFIKITYANQKEDGISRYYTVGDSPKTVHENESYAEKTIFMTHRFADVALYSFNTEVNITIKGRLSIFAVHNKVFNGSVYDLYGKFIGNISNENNSYGAFFPNGGVVVLYTPEPVMYYTNVLLISNPVSCHKIAVSNDPNAYFLITRPLSGAIRNFTFAPNTNFCYVFLAPSKMNFEVESNFYGSDYAYGFVPEDKFKTMTFLRKTTTSVVGKSIIMILVSFTDMSNYLFINQTVNESLRYNMNLTTTFNITDKPFIFTNDKIIGDDDGLKTIQRIVYFVLISMVVILIMFAFTSFLFHTAIKCRSTPETHQEENHIDQGFANYTPTSPGFGDEVYNNSDDIIALDDFSDGGPQEVERVNSSRNVSRSPYLESEVPTSNPYLEPLLSSK